MNPTILHIGKYYPPYRGGMESFLADLVGALEESGVSSAALVHSANAKGGRWEGSIAKVLRVPSYGRLLYVPISPAFPMYLERAIRDVSPDVLHFHLPNPSAYWALLSPAARRLPWVVHWHSDVLTPESPLPLRLAYRPYRFLEAAMLCRAKAIIATSPDYAQASPPLAHFADKTTVIPLGISGGRLPDASEQAVRSANTKWPKDAALKVLVVGRFTYYKGHHSFLKALAKVPKAAAVFVGEGELRREMMALAGELGLGSRVQFLGGVDEEQLAGLYATADAACLPALDRAEAFGMVLLEAMRYEKALIASNIAGSGVPWVVRKCECGLLAKPGDAESLADAMRRLIEKPDRRMEMARHGAAVYREIFRIESVAEQVLALYRRILN